MTEEKINIPNYDLLAKYFAGECNNAEKQAVEIWRSTSAQTKRDFDSLYFLWSNSNRNIVAQNIDTDKSWEKFQAKIAQKANPNRLQIVFYRKTFLRIAAILVLGILIAILYKYKFQNAEIQMAVAQTEVVEIQLNDNSSVSLNKNSKLEYPDEFDQNKRKVKLQGEAYFKVAKNAEKQFIIETKHALVKVVGTEFNVKAYDSLETTVVSVNQGIVQFCLLSDTTKKVILTKGEVGIIDHKTGNILEQEAENITIDFWRTKVLKFRNARLDVVTSALTEVYGVNFIFANENIKNCRLNFEFPDMKIDEVLDIIAMTFDLKFTRKGEVYSIEGEGCAK